MINKILVMWLLSSSLVFASVTFPQALDVYNKLGGRIPLVLNRSQAINAAYVGHFIEINVGMLKFLRNENELAMVLGHEIAHWKRRDNGSTQVREFAADALGMAIMTKAGYNRCDGAKFMSRLHFPSDYTHPASEERYKRLSIGCHL